MARSVGGRQPLGRKLEEMGRADRANRVIAGPGIEISESAAGSMISAIATEGTARYVKTTSTITARSGTDPAFTLGTGTASYRPLNAAGTTRSGGTMTIRNGLSSSIPSGRLVLVIYTEGHWVAGVGDCS